MATIEADNTREILGIRIDNLEKRLKTAVETIKEQMDPKMDI